MDMVTPSIVVPPGRVRGCRNYESSPRGYRRVDGWEIFDGRPKPSAAEFKVVTFNQGSSSFVAGDVISGAFSGKTARVIHNPSIYNGDFSDGNAEGAFPVMEDTGLLHGEPFQIGGVDIGVTTSAPGDSGPTTLEEDEEWTLAARERIRLTIQAVPGSGPIRGIAVYDGGVYAFRDNAAGTAGVMHKATASGWSSIALHKSLAFDAGTSEIKPGETITGSTSGAKGTVLRVVLQDGDWTTDDGEGRFIFAPITGFHTNFVDNETVLSTAAGSATANGVSSQITLPPGGRYQFDTNNFLATTGTMALYGANGVGYAFEYAGDTLTPIITGEENDNPSRVVAHSDHLFLSYEDGRFFHSAIFKPLNFEIIQGALLGGIGEPITEMVQTATGELAIFGRNRVAVLYGTNAENWRLTILTNESGAVPWTAQLIGMPLYLDHVGVRSLDATQAWGNFSLGTKTQLVQTYVATKTKAGVYPVGSLRVREKDQYRLFWSDGSGLSIYFGRKQPENMLFQVDFTPSCLGAGEDVNYREIMFAGSDDGFVYQIDSGVSANGDNILSYLRLPFNHVGSPTNDKRWQKAVLEVEAPSHTKLAITYICSYGDTDLSQASEQDLIVRGGGGLWNEAIWNQFKWSSPLEGIASIHIDGIGQNISLVVIGDSNYDEPHVLHGVTLHFNYRRLVR